jgi:hypothetical protein
LERATDNTLRTEMLHELSVDECVQSLATAPGKPADARVDNARR